jgi:hypothetical protein
VRVAPAHLLTTPTAFPLSPVSHAFIILEPGSPFPKDGARLPSLLLVQGTALCPQTAAQATQILGHVLQGQVVGIFLNFFGFKVLVPPSRVGSVVGDGGEGAPE